MLAQDKVKINCKAPMTCPVIATPNDVKGSLLKSSRVDRILSPAPKQLTQHARMRRGRKPKTSIAQNETENGTPFEDGGDRKLNCGTCNRFYRSDQR